MQKQRREAPAASRMYQQFLLVLAGPCAPLVRPFGKEFYAVREQIQS